LISGVEKLVAEYRTFLKVIKDRAAHLYESKDGISFITTSLINFITTATVKRNNPLS
jgi:hypothetical protein